MERIRSSEITKTTEKVNKPLKYTEEGITKKQKYKKQEQRTKKIDQLKDQNKTSKATHLFASQSF